MALVERTTVETADGFRDAWFWHHTAGSKVVRDLLRGLGISSSGAGSVISTVVGSQHGWGGVVALYDGDQDWVAAVAEEHPPFHRVDSPADHRVATWLGASLNRRGVVNRRDPDRRLFSDGGRLPVGYSTLVGDGPAPAEFFTVETSNAPATRPDSLPRVDVSAAGRVTARGIRLHSLQVAISLADQIVDSAEGETTWAEMLRPGLYRLYQWVESDSLPQPDERTLREHLGETAERLSKLESVTSSLRRLAKHVTDALELF